MPARSSSSIPAVLAQLGRLEPDTVADLRPYLDSVPDPRSRLADDGRARQADARSTYEATLSEVLDELGADETLGSLVRALRR